MRYLLENKINKLAQIHSATKRQLAVFAFDYITAQIILDGLYEIDELELFSGWLNSLGEKKIFDGIAVDIGANIGNHSLYFSDFFTEIIAFEPHPRSFELLKINSTLVNNIKCLNLGLSSKAREAKLYVNGRNMSGAKLEKSSKNESADINLSTLDLVLNELEKKVKVIKIDVEGHEFEVLSGAKKTIIKHQPLILFEQHKDDFSDGTSNVIELIRSYGYSHFACVEKKQNIPKYLPKKLSYFYAGITQLINGSSRQITEINKFQPQFYTFIVAIPDWIYKCVNSESIKKNQR